jgi:hypothetical protein
LTFPSGTLNSKALYWLSSAAFLFMTSMAGFGQIDKYIIGQGNVWADMEYSGKLGQLTFLLNIVALLCLPLAARFTDRKLGATKAIYIVLVMGIWPGILGIISEYFAFFSFFGLLFFIAFFTINIPSLITQLYHPEDRDRAFLLYLLFAAVSPNFTQRLTQVLLEYVGLHGTVAIFLAFSLGAIACYALANRHFHHPSTDPFWPQDFILLKKTPIFNLFILVLAVQSFLGLAVAQTEFLFSFPFMEKIKSFAGIPSTSTFQGIVLSDLLSFFMIPVLFYWQSRAQKGKEMKTLIKLLGGGICLMLAPLLLGILSTNNDFVATPPWALTTLTMFLLSWAIIYLAPSLYTLLTVLGSQKKPVFSASLFLLSFSLSGIISLLTSKIFHYSPGLGSVFCFLYATLVFSALRWWYGTLKTS